MNTSITYTTLHYHTLLGIYLPSQDELSLQLYILSLLCTPELANPNLWQKGTILHQSQLITNELFIQITSRTIGLFYVYQLVEQESLCLPCKPIISIYLDSFISAMKSWSKLYEKKEPVIHIAWCNQTQTLFITEKIFIPQKISLFKKFLQKVTNL